ncbi:hypothetical protein [Streptomyces antibioticus]|uniref:Integral membrane protein n=1 Tax=Streptomyces antibioticus TaxID=1890 RepID=A0ABX3LFN8_STRAT|nr:hypothetical protein [Streptomyces antibioticus]MCX5170988.1 hypothetical protein [Streptomyces antibioticus]OOQ49232.1 hypothetical protein AFM16_23495 [Streptomyces antibioticus]
MTESTPPSPAPSSPSEPQPVDGNPYAQPAADAPPAPDATATATAAPAPAPAPAPVAGGNPFAAQPGAVPPPFPAAPRQGNLVLGLLTALVVALVTAGIYGGIVGATEYEIGYAAVGVGLLVGFAAGKVGGANPVLPVVSAVLALGAVYLGQIIGIGIIMADIAGVSATEIFSEHLDLITEGWSEEADALSFVFLGIGAFAAFSGAKKGAA